jgi:hypothetical protein
MPNPPPLPPIVNGPVYKTSTQVNVSNVLPNSTVWLYNDAASTNIVGKTTSTSAGSIWVPLTAAINVGQPITAKQEYTGSDPSIAVSGQSPASTLPMPVLPDPTPLPTPIFASGMCTCMDSIYVDGLIPGATLTVKMGAATMVSAAPVTQTPQWFQLLAVTTENAQLTAQQNIGALKSAVATSAPIPVAPPLQAPVISPTPVDCQTNINFSNMQPGADLKLINNGVDYFATSPARAYNLYDLAPLQPGASSAQQYFTKCDQKAEPILNFNVKKAPPQFPKVSYAPCADVTLLNVTNVVGGEILTLTASYSTNSGPVKQPLGSCGVSGPGPIPLPKGWYPSTAVGPVTLEIGALLCDQQLPNPGFTAVVVKEPPGPYPAPTLQQPLYDCAASVFVQGANTGCLIQVFAEGPPLIPRSAPVVATTANFPVRLLSPLNTGEKIYVLQLGCGATTPHAPAVTVLAPPKLVPPQVVGNYVLTTATSVLVQDVVPGAQVTLFVNGSARNAPVDSIQAEASPPVGSPGLMECNLPVGSPALAPQDVLTAGQALCGVITLPAAGGGGVQVQTPVPAPFPNPPGQTDPGGLGSDSNYLMYTPSGSGCSNLLNVSVTITVTEPIVFVSASGSTQGFGFQMNCYSPKGKVCAWQQYIIAVLNAEVTGVINTWPETGTPIIVPASAAPPNGGSYPVKLVSLSSNNLPVPYTLQIQLGNDSAGNVISVTWTVNGTTFPTQTISSLLSTYGQPSTDIAPIIAFEMDFVGPIGGESAVLKSGKGYFTYSAKSPLTVFTSTPTTDYPPCVEFLDTTGETTNSVYGVLPANPGTPFQQTFDVTTAPAISRPRTRPPRWLRLKMKT